MTKTKTVAIAIVGEGVGDMVSAPHQPQPQEGSMNLAPLLWMGWLCAIAFGFFALASAWGGGYVSGRNAAEAERAALAAKLQAIRACLEVVK